MIKFFIKNLILGYRKFLSPLLGKNCRFYPSCSEYALICIEKYGILLGLWRTFLRVIKCHPFHPGGVDLP